MSSGEGDALDPSGECVVPAEPGQAHGPCRKGEVALSSEGRGGRTTLLTASPSNELRLLGGGAGLPGATAAAMAAATSADCSCIMSRRMPSKSGRWVWS